MNKTVQIAIDGPAGAGKSSVAKILANKLGFIYIDTGAMYRALTYKALKNNIKFNQKQALINLAGNTAIDFKNEQNSTSQRIFCDGQDISEMIRSPEVSQNVSLIAAIPEIRDYMVKLQQELGSKNNVIMDGRDIGTIVLPNAKYKFFLTASLEERANRRALELNEKGYQVDYNEVYNEISRRDKLDSERDVAPLKPAEDAIIIDTSNLNIEEVVNKILSLVLGES